MRNILITIFTSILFVFCILPSLLKINLPKNYLFEITFESVTGIISVISILIILFWNKAKSFCQRYRNTCKLSKPPLVYPDYIFTFLFLSCLLILLFKQDLVLGTPLRFWGFLTVNIFLLLVGIIFICFLKYKKKENVPAPVADDTISLSDEPIKLAKHDILVRNGFIEELYKEITCLPFNDSFVFGMHGKWGEGKTSAIYLLLERFKDNKTFIVVNFDPWHFNDEKAIISAFYGTIEKSINNKFIFPNLKRAFTKYQKILSSGLSQAGIKINSFLCEESIEEVKKRIESYIARIDIKLLIIVDDIDRLQPNEILLVFKLVRLNTKFENTIFLLVFDQNVVQKVLEVNPKTAPEFLEKIVQKPVILPKIESEYIDDFLRDELKVLFQRLKLDERRVDNETANFYYLYRHHANNLFVTLRNVKRYINSISSSIPPIVVEIDLSDFLILELIKVFAPSLYDDIYECRWFYYDKGGYNPLGGLSNEEKIKVIKIHVEEYLDVKLIRSQKEAFKNILGALFPNICKAFGLHNPFSEDKLARQERHIYSTSFPKYFTLKVPISEMSDAFVSQVVSSWEILKPKKLTDAITKTIIHSKDEGKLIKFLNKLEELNNVLNSKVISSLIRSLYQNSEKYDRYVVRSFFDTEIFVAMNLIVSLLSDRIENPELHNLLEEIMTNTDSLDFASGVYMLCAQERNRNSNPKLDRLPVIKEVLVNRFKKEFIETGTSFFLTEEPGYVLKRLWDLCAEVENIDHKKCTCAEYVNNILKQNPKHVGKLLNCFDNRAFNPDKKIVSLDITVIGTYLDINELYCKIMEASKDAYTSDNEKELVENFIKGYKSIEENMSDNE